MPSIAQRRFSGGEIAPAFYPGVDLAKYAASARTIQNFQVKRTGGVENRTGFQFIGELPFSFTLGRLIPFVFSDSQTYQLAFTDKKMRVIKNGAFVYSPFLNPLTISGISHNTICQITLSDNLMPTGTLVDISNVGGMTQLNGRRFIINFVAGTTYNLMQIDGVTNVNSTAYTPWTSGGTVQNVYTLATPYAEADLADLHYLQSADTITLTRQGYPQYQLKRTADASWAFTAMTFTARTSVPPSLTLTDQGGGGGTPYGAYGYVVTAVDSTTLEESLKSNEIGTSNALTTNGTFNTLNWGPVTNAKYYNVYKAVPFNGTMGFIGSVLTNTFQDSFPGSVPDYTISTTIANDPFNKIVTITGITRFSQGVIASAAHGLVNGRTVTISGVVGMTQINGLTGTVYFVDADHFSLTVSGVLLDTSGFSAYTSGGKASSTDQWPATAAYYQERLCFANLVNDPIGFYASRSSEYTGFSSSIPSRADDAIIFEVVSRKTADIRHIVDAGTLVILASGSEHICHGDLAGTLTPSSINRKQHASIGSATLQPVAIDDTIVFLQTQGAKVYDLGIDINWGTVTMKPKELTIMAPHLTQGGLKITDWCVQQNPNNIVWARRSDGQLLGLTYVKEQEIIAWHQHTIGNGITDAIENVSSCPENGQHSVYVITKRTINGVIRRFVERAYSRQLIVNNPLTYTNWALSGACFLDASLSFDGRNQNGLNAIAVTSIGTFTYQDTVTLTASSPTFSSSDIGTYLFMLSPEGIVVRFKIVNQFDSVTVSAIPNRTVPVSLQGAGTWQWAKAVTSVSGLWHLEGKSVAITADGFVVASPNNPGYPTFTVTNGSVTLPGPAATVQVGLPYVSTLQTLDVDTANGETVGNKAKLIDEIDLYLEQSRGGFFSSGLAADDATLPTDGFTELPGDFDADDETPPELITDTRRMNIQSEWNYNGRVILRQIDPLPITINGVIPSGAIPFGQGV